MMEEQQKLCSTEETQSHMMMQPLEQQKADFASYSVGATLSMGEPTEPNLDPKDSSEHFLV